MSFVHLHTHSEYSLLDGANRLPDLVAHVRKLGMDSLAVTDHGNLHAAWAFYDEARREKIRPILGFEAYLAFGPRTARERAPGAPAAYSHLVLLAKNRAGYKNLVRLSSIGFTEGFYRRPRIDREVLAAHAEGIIGLAACLSGEVSLYLRQGNYEEAKRSAEWFARTFGPEGFWLEIQKHGIPEEDLVTEGMLRLGRELGLGVVATNDAHYLRRARTPRRTTCCSRSGPVPTSTIPSDSALPARSPTSSRKPKCGSSFPNCPTRWPTPRLVANRCEFDFEKRYFLPAFPKLPPAVRPRGRLAASRWPRMGAVMRYGSPPPDGTISGGEYDSLPAHVRERLEFELKVIRESGYSGYFLIVADFIRRAREKDIPGRARAAARPPARMVAYALRITDVDPLRFDLLFERFLNPERVSMPDIDVDFCFERRGEVIEYVRERYGRDVGGPDRRLRHDEGAGGHQGRGPGPQGAPGRRGQAVQADPVEARPIR